MSSVIEHFKDHTILKAAQLNALVDGVNRIAEQQQAQDSSGLLPTVATACIAAGMSNRRVSRRGLLSCRWLQERF